MADRPDYDNVALGDTSLLALSRLSRDGRYRDLQLTNY